MADRTIKVTLRANVDDFKRNVSAASRSLEELAKSANQDVAKTGMGRLTQSMQLQREEWDRVGTAATAFGVATAGALTLSAKSAMDWESSFAGVRKTVDGTDADFRMLEEGLRGLARELPASHAEIAAVAEAAGQLGIQTPNILDFTRVMIDMGEATNLSADEAATTLARFANIMGTSQAEFSNMGSSIVELGNNFATTEREIADMALRLASAGSQIGLTEGDVLGIATALSSVGIEAEAGGTAFSRVMLDMRKAVDTGSEKLATFAQVAGMSTSEFASMFRENAGGALTEFVAGLGRMEAAGQSTQPVLEALGMTDIRVGNALRSSANAADLFADAMKTGNEAYAANTALSEEAQQRYATLAAQWQMMKNAIGEVAISLGQALMPALELVVGGIRSFAGFISSLPPGLQSLVAGFGALATAVSLGAGAFLLLGPRVIEGYKAFKTLAGVIPGLNLSLGQIPRTVGAAATAFMRLALPVTAFAGIFALTDYMKSGDHFYDSSVGAEKLSDALLDMARNGSTASTAFNELGVIQDFFAGTKNEVRDLDAVVGQFQRNVNNGWGGGLEKLERIMGGNTDDDRALKYIQELDATLAHMVNSGHAAEAEQVMSQLMGSLNFENLEVDADFITGQFTLFNEALAEAAASGESFSAGMTLAAGAADLAGSAAESAAGAEERLGAAYEAQIRSISDVIAKRRELSDRATSIYDAELAWVRAQEALNGALEDSSLAVDRTTDSWDLYTTAGQKGYEATLSTRDAMRATADAMKSQGSSMDDVRGKLDSMYQVWEDQAVAMGMSREAARDLAVELGLFPDEIVTQMTVDADGVYSTVNDVFLEIDGRTGEILIDGDPAPLDATISEVLGLMPDHEGNISVNGTTFKATATVEDLTRWVSGQEAFLQVLAETGGAMLGVQAARNATKRTPATLRLVDDPWAFNVGVTLARRRTNTHPATLRVVDNSAPFNVGVSLARASAGRTPATVKVQANTSPFRSTLGLIAGKIVGTSYVNIVGRNLGVGAGFASGGYVRGPGTTTSDSIPAWLSDQEFVTRAKAVKFYGLDFMNAVNNMTFRVPAYRDGGYVSARSQVAPSVNVSAPSFENVKVSGSFMIGDTLVPLIDGRISSNPSVKAVAGLMRHGKRWATQNGGR